MCGTFMALSGYWKCQAFAQQTERERERERECVCVCVCVRARACVRTRARVCARVCPCVSHLLETQSQQNFKTRHPLQE
jgi:hypothetical protein